ncbi:MAG: hypothetical protein ACFB2Z_03820 [Maricaulaceae bacterium]
MQIAPVAPVYALSARRRSPADTAALEPEADRRTAQSGRRRSDARPAVEPPHVPFTAPFMAHILAETSEVDTPPAPQPAAGYAADAPQSAPRAYEWRA